MRVDVVYAEAHAQTVIGVEVPAGATVEQAICASGILTRFPKIDLARNAVGIHGNRARLTDPLQVHDRIEIYRPLIVDPKEARRRRARKKKPFT